MRLLVTHHTICHFLHLPLRLVVYSSQLFSRGETPLYGTQHLACFSKQAQILQAEPTYVHVRSNLKLTSYTVTIFIKIVPGKFYGKLLRDASTHILRPAQCKRHPSDTKGERITSISLANYEQPTTGNLYYRAIRKAALQHRQPASTWTSHDSCCPKDNDKINTHCYSIA